MPLPIAHPAAVLLLRPLCPRYLDLAALVIGSLAPDVCYLFGNKVVEMSAHRFWGGTVFGLVIGVGWLLAYYALRHRVAALLPEPWQDAVAPLVQGGELRLVRTGLFSLLLGVWSHLVLDALTHRDGWLVGSLPPLQYSLGELWGRQARVHTLLWFFCTLAGVFLLAASYLDVLNRRAGNPKKTWARWIWAAGASGTVLGIALIHRLLNHRLEVIITVAAMLGLATAFILLTGRRNRLGRDAPAP